MEEIIIGEDVTFDTLTEVLPDEAQRTEGLAVEEYEKPEVPEKTTNKEEGE